MPRNKLKELREKEGLTIRRLEQVSGISHTQLTHIENGKRNLTSRNAKTLADYFGVSIDYLLGHTPKVACRVEALRTAKGMSQRELSEAIGFSHATISRIEAGDRKISTPQARALADFFGVTIGYLLGVDESAEPIVEEPEITDEEVEKRYFRTTKQGYRMVYMPESGMANKNGWVLLHRIVMAKSIGRDLRPEEVVHHIDGDKTNNNLSNLMLFPNNAEHRRYHAKQKRDQKIAELLEK